MKTDQNVAVIHYRDINTWYINKITKFFNFDWYLNLISGGSFMNIFVFFLVLLLLTFILYLSGNKHYKLYKNIFCKTQFKEKYNPDFDTNDWDLHRNRLKKFGRSQYKGLTFFVSEQNKIYYLSEEGDKVYC